MTPSMPERAYLAHHAARRPRWWVLAGAALVSLAAGVALAAAGPGGAGEPLPAPAVSTSPAPTPEPTPTGTIDEEDGYVG